MGNSGSFPGSNLLGDRYICRIKPACEIIVVQGQPFVKGIMVSLAIRKTKLDEVLACREDRDIFFLPPLPLSPLCPFLQMRSPEEDLGCGPERGVGRGDVRDALHFMNVRYRAFGSGLDEYQSNIIFPGNGTLSKRFPLLSPLKYPWKQCFSELYWHVARVLPAEFCNGPTGLFRKLRRRGAGLVEEQE
jgi:hypothetical protein